jgi:aminoglycoside phosphotransferase (APT) family kinase protein
MMTHFPGYDVDAVKAWLQKALPSLVLPLTWQKLEGGHSNLTYLITDAEGVKRVIRRPPLGQLLPKAHDMSREWALLCALAPTPVPVAAPLAFCEDPSITGAHFYVMGYVDGQPLYSSEDTERLAPEQTRRRLAESFIDVLADLHAIDPDEAGLGDLGKRDSYVARQVKTWYRSWTASVGPAGLDDPRAHEMRAFFLEHLPDQGPARIVHGDYGLHNCLIGADQTVVAVVDWEISTLGDPMADLAYALNIWPEKIPGETLLPHSPTSPAGFPPRRELADRYADRTGRDLSQLDFYLGFNRWKSACIVHGVYARYKEGKKSTEGVDLEGLRQSIDRSLTGAAAALARF